MAILRSDDLGFEFRYGGLEDGWVQYHFYFLWKGEPVFRDEPLKRSTSLWASRPKSAFRANSDRRDEFIPFLRRVLENDEPDYWEPMEPDIIVAIYPNMLFPFVRPARVLWVSEEVKREAEERARLKAQQPKLPDDLYTFMPMVDGYNFEGSRGYYWQGFLMQMVVTRKDLETFTRELEREYAEFKKKFGLEDGDWG